ncbi:MAG: serine hydrolase domain-containing protein [Saprospiraceae bacterium]
MNFKIILLLGICISFTYCKNEIANSTETPLPPNSNTDRINEYITALTSLKEFNGCVLVHQDGKEIFKKAFNLTDQKDSSLYVTTISQFDVRSISKLMAKASILQLEQEGKIKRTDYLNKYIPDFPNGKKITIQHLMSNQSGLPREYVDFKQNEFDLSNEQIIDLAKKQKLEFEPGTDTRYSNVGFQVLYFVIGQISKTSFSQNLHYIFFDRLQMDDSGGHFYADNSNLTKYAYGHELDDEGDIVAIKNFPPSTFKMGKIYSTVDDLMSFLNHLEKEPFLSNLKNENGVIGHAGGTDGKRAYVHSNPDLKYKFVFLTNYDAIPFQKIVEDLQKILEGKPYEIPKEVNRIAINLPENVLKKYVGKYDFVEIEHLILDIKLEEGKLVVYQDGENNGTLFPESKTVFFSDKKSEESFEFQKNDKDSFDAIMGFRGAKWKGVRL